MLGGTGECVKTSPRFVMGSLCFDGSGDGDIEDARLGLWPITGRHDWCGEFQPLLSGGDTHIGKLDLSPRIYNSINNDLRCHGGRIIITVAELKDAYNTGRLKKMKNFGAVSLREVARKLGDYHDEP